MATSIKTKILLPRDTFANWEASSRVLQAGELVLAYDGSGKFRLFEGDGKVFGENASGVKELKLDAKQVVLSGDAEVTLQAALDDLKTAAGNALTAVSGSGTGVVTGISKDGQTVTASFTDVSGTKTIDGANAITSITQDATGKITSVAGITALTAHQSLDNYYTKTDVNSISSELSGMMASGIQGLDVADTAVEHKFVTAVSETDGKISVTRGQPSLGDLSDGGTVALKGDTSTAISSDETVAGAKKYADAKLAQNLADYYKKAETSSAAEITTKFGNYYAKNETSSKTEIETALEGKQAAGNYLSSNALANYKTYSDTLTALTADGFAKVGESTDLSTASTIEGAKKYADARISEVTAGELTAYYKKTETSSAEELTAEFGKYYKKTETSSATELNTKFETTLTAVSGTGTGVVTGISKDGQTVTASFTDVSGTKTASTGKALAGVTQNAAGQITAFTEISVLAASDVKIGYNSDAKKIVLSAAGQTSEIDCADFIKDGMLSSATYDPVSHNIILTFNTDAGATPISVDVGALVDTYEAADSDTVSLSVTSNTFKGEVKDDSLTMAKFSPTETFLFDCGSASV